MTKLRHVKVVFQTQHDAIGAGSYFRIIETLHESASCFFWIFELSKGLHSLFTATKKTGRESIAACLVWVKVE